MINKVIKKLGIILLIILFYGIQLLFVPIDLLWVNIPTWAIFILLGLALIVTCLRVCKLHLSHRRGRLLSVVAVQSIIIVCALFCIYCNPYYHSISFHSNDSYESMPSSQTYTYKEAKEDLDYMMKYLQKDHPAFIHNTPEAIDIAYNQCISNLKQMDTITTITLWRELERVLSTLQDGHTSINWYSSDEHYLKYLSDHKKWGETLIAINNKSIDEILNEKKTLFSYEIISFAKAQLANYLCSKEGLEYLGYNTDMGITYTFEDTSGVKLDTTYYSEDYVPYTEYSEYSNKENSSSEEASFVSYTIDKSKNIGIFTLKSCDCNKEYTDCLRAFFTDVKKQSISNVVVDLRNNGGGNSLVANKFLEYLDVNTYRTGSMRWRLGPFLTKRSVGKHVNSKQKDLTFTGNIYVMTSTTTFSSAMLFTQYISDNKLGTIVGEIPGNAPNGYGDIAVFKTPNAKLYFSVSTKIFTRADRSVKQNYIQPDIECPAEDALDTIYSLIES